MPILENARQVDARNGTFIDVTGSVFLGSNDPLGYANVQRSKISAARFRLPSMPKMLGREKELEQVIRTLIEADYAASLLIVAAGGVGKSTLATSALHNPKVISKFGERRFFVRCDAAASGGQLIGILSEAFGAVDNGTEPIGGILEFIHESPVFLVLDNLETPWQQDTYGVETLIERIMQCPNISLIMTSRLHTLFASSLIELKPVSPEVSKEIFLATYSMTSRRSLTAEENRVLHTMLPRLGGVCLAVVLLARVAATSDILSLPRRWENMGTKLIRIGSGNHPLTSLDVSIELSINSPTMTDASDSLDLLSLLSFLPSGFPDSNHLDRISPPACDFSAASFILFNISLAFKDPDSRVKVLAPVREFMRRYYPLRTRKLEVADPLCRYYMSIFGDCSTQQHVEVGKAEFLNVLEIAELALDNYSTLGPEVATGLLIHDLRWNSKRLGDLHQRAAELLKESHEVKLLANCIMANIAASFSSADLSTDRHCVGTQALLNCLQMILDAPQLHRCLRPPLVKALIKLSSASGCYPESIILKGMRVCGTSPIAGGSAADIWNGVWNGQDVAIKAIRIFAHTDVASKLKDFVREVAIWRQLSHPNVLPLYGVHLFHYSQHCTVTVSPLMQNGNIVEYLRHVPATNRYPLILDIVQGLEYLHNLDPSITHSDLRGVNVLITPSIRACLADFGMSLAAHYKISRYLSSELEDPELLEQEQLEQELLTNTNSTIPGTTRWLAPEMLPNGNVEHFRGFTTAADMYSFGCLCYEVFSGNVPFYEMFNNFQVMLAVSRGERPTRPPPHLHLTCGLDDDMWQFIEKCWEASPAKRPTASEAVTYLSSRLNLGRDERPHGDWDLSLVRHPPPDFLDEAHSLAKAYAEFFAG